MGAVAAVLLAAALGVAPAAAAEPVEPGTAVYAVVVTDTSTGPGGEATERSEEGSLRIACVDDVCRVVAEPGFGFLSTVDLARGAALSGEASTGAAGSPCAGGRGPREIRVEATASGITATLDQQAVDWVDCPDGTEGYAHARTVVWEGTPVAVDPCVFDEAKCTGAPSASHLASGDPAAPSVLSALTPPAELRVAPQQAVWAAVLTIILVLLVAFPTALLNSAVEAGGDRWTAWRAARRRSADADAAVPGDGDAAPVPRAWTHSWWWAALGVLAASVISAFVDPQFGPNPGSGRVILSILLSFGVDVVLGWLLVVWVVSRLQPGATHDYTFRPLTLLVVVAAVVFTRLTGFEPGIVFGLVAGVAFGALVGAAAEAKAALTTLGYAFAAAWVAWVLYGVVAPSIGGSFGATLLGETLAAIAVGGMAALPIALVPLGGLPGRAIWQWRRTVWAGCYAAGLLAFFVVLMPMPFSWAEVGWELSAWVGVYACYAVVAVAAWLVLSRPWRKKTDEDAAAGETGEAADRVEV